jgi:hypothetical protein
MPSPSQPSERPMRLLDQIDWCCRRRHYRRRTSDAYTYWARRFILFHNRSHPNTLGKADVVTFLDALVAADVAALTHSQALNALVFLYRDVLELPFGWLEELDRPKRPRRLPVALSCA